MEFKAKWYFQWSTNPNHMETQLHAHPIGDLHKKRGEEKNKYIIGGGLHFKYVEASIDQQLLC